MKPEIPFSDGTRGVLQCLKPKGELVTDLLNLLACLLTKKERSFNQNPPIWFFPTNVSVISSAHS